MTDLPRNSESRSAAAMRSAASRVDDASNAIHALQTLLTQRVNAVTRNWSPEQTGEFMRAYLSFDRDVSRIQSSLDDLHVALTMSVRECVKAGSER